MLILADLFTRHLEFYRFRSPPSLRILNPVVGTRRIAVLFLDFTVKNRQKCEIRRKETQEPRSNNTS